MLADLEVGRVSGGLDEVSRRIDREQSMTAAAALSCNQNCGVRPRTLVDQLLAMAILHAPQMLADNLSHPEHRGRV